MRDACRCVELKLSAGSRFAVAAENNRSNHRTQRSVRCTAMKSAKHTEVYRGGKVLTTCTGRCFVNSACRRKREISTNGESNDASRCVDWPIRERELNRGRPRVIVVVPVARPGAQPECHIEGKRVRRLCG